MTAEFLKLYVENLEIFSLEMNRTEELIRLSNNDIKALTLVVEEKLKRLFAEMINKQSVDSDLMEPNSQIKVIYVLMKQIKNINAEKRSLTRKACDILDKYLVSLDENIGNVEMNNDSDTELSNAICSIKPHIRQPVEGQALVVDLIRKIENDKTKSESETDLMVVDDVNKNVEMFSQNIIKGMSLKDMPRANAEPKSNVSELIHRLDNLQHFTDKIVDICLEMRRRYRTGLPDTLDTPTDYEDSDSSTEEDAELCHCRSQDLGRMVACDNTECKIKWYHFECVALHINPEGSWYCPSCVIFENVTT